MGFLFHRLRTLFWTAFYHALGGLVFTRLGRGARFQGWIDIPQRHGRISIGRNAHVCARVEFSVPNNAELIIGDGTFIGRGTLISAHRRVTIGADVLVAENVSIHDNNHKMGDPARPIQQQGFEAEPLEIGDDCWIGARAVLVKGAGLGRRCILGAGAVLTKRLPDHTRAAGVPAQPLTSRPTSWFSILDRTAKRGEASPSCPICGGATTRVSSEAQYSYWRCLHCGTAHLHPQPSAEFLENFYHDFHLPARDGGLFENFEERMRADFSAKIRIVARYLATPKKTGRDALRLLDVGCGKGDFVDELSRCGFLAEGIDLSANAVAEGSAHGIAGLNAGHLHQQSDWADRFDAVTAWATIEHVPDPLLFLDSIRTALKPDGLLFLDTGLIGDVVDRCAPGLVQWYDAPQHLFVFSRRGIEEMLEKAGFTLLHFDAHFERTPLRRVIKYGRNRALALVIGGLFRLALGRSAYARMRIETKMPFGSLMFVVARRKATS
jgi:acetyltransferase-like isoleucine patch superfamily enzyme/SAM-dependent methyltransferase